MNESRVLHYKLIRKDSLARMDGSHPDCIYGLGKDAEGNYILEFEYDDWSRARRHLLELMDRERDYVPPVRDDVDPSELQFQLSVGTHQKVSW